jgi:hypothetical protein
MFIIIERLQAVKRDYTGSAGVKSRSSLFTVKVTNASTDAVKTALYVVRYCK